MIDSMKVVISGGFRSIFRFPYMRWGLEEKDWTRWRRGGGLSADHYRVDDNGLR